MEDISLEDVVLQNLITNDTFLRKAIPYIKEEYFSEHINRCIFRALNTYFLKNNQTPNQAILAIETKEDSKVSHKEIDSVLKTITNLYQSEMIGDTEWLSQSAEKWCQDREMYLSIVKAIAIYDGTDKTLLPSSIPDMMKTALSVSFDANIGIDWEDDSEARYDRYEIPQNKIPFDIETLNDITLGGITRKTLSLILAGVHVGKTLSLVHLAAGYARLGYQVLYISMEMDENEILHRIDANMIKTPMHLIREMGKSKFIKRIDLIKSKGYGKIKVIQFPTSAAHVGHFKNIINELNIKMNWSPDVVMIDYIGCVASNRIKVGSTNSHFYLKSVAEEIRAMAIEYNIACWSAMQLTRSGMGSSDVEMTDIAECCSLTTNVIKKSGNEYISSLLADLKIGDIIKGYEKDVIVKRIFPIKKKQAIRITTKTGKQIVCSMDHKIPTQKGLVCYNNGLIVGDQVTVLGIEERSK